MPSSKGWYVHTVAEDSQDSDHAADGKAGLLIGRNNQVYRCPSFFISRVVTRVKSDEKVCVALQTCEIEVLHKSASRVHACITFDTKQQPFIVDLSSTHGEPCTAISLKTPILLRCRKVQNVEQYSSNGLTRCVSEIRMLRQANSGGAGLRRGIRVRRVEGEGQVAEGHSGAQSQEAVFGVNEFKLLQPM